MSRLLWLAPLVLTAAVPVQGQQTRGQAAAQTVTRIALRSEFMTRAEYNTNARTLTIYFEDGSIYRYEAVTQNTVTAFRNSRDPDEYFNDSIRDSFKFTRLTPTKIRTPRRSRNRSNRTAATRTPVRCAALNQLQRQNVVSEALAAVAYDDATQCLVVYFDRRGTYAYANVPKDVYRRLLQTGPDPAIYFNESVRTRYRNQRLAN